MNRSARILAVSMVLAGGCALNLLLAIPACSRTSDPTAAAVLANDTDPGKAIFEKNCIRCHPYGKKGVGPNLSKKDLTVEQVTKQVRKGGLVMPSFSQTEISDAQLAQLAPFVVSLKSKISEE